MFSRRSDWPHKLNQWTEVLRQAKNAKTPLVDLTVTNPTECEFSFLKESLLGPLSSLENLQYDPVCAGKSSAREAIGEYYQKSGIDIGENEIFLTASTSEAYAQVFRLLCDPRDTVAVPRPSYPLFEYLASLESVKINYYDLYDASGWIVSRADIEKRIKEGIRSLIAINPNNPTGNYFLKEDQEYLQTLLAAKEIPIIIDEVFFDFPLKVNPEITSSLIIEPETLTFTLSGISKVLALPQMKVSWLIVRGPQKRVTEAKRRLEIILDMYLSVNTPSQNALREWLAMAPVIQGEIRERLRANYKYLKSVFDEKTLCRVLDTEGGWSAVIRLPGVRSEGEWVMDFLKKHHVVVYPGYFYDFTREAYFIVSLLTPEDIFRAGTEKIATYLRNFNDLH